MDTTEKILVPTPPHYPASPDTVQTPTPPPQQQQLHTQYPTQYPHDPYTAHMDVHSNPDQLQLQLQREQPYAQMPMSANHQHQPRSEQDPPLHPSAYGQKGGEWQAGLCGCTPCTSCLLSWCLPCILVGQTSERIRDPSMQNADLLNSDCLIHGAITCFTGCGWIYGLLKRGEIRERYDIKGSGFGDCCVSYWCPCCALIQQDNEVRLRQQNAQPTPPRGYEAQTPMEMPKPAYHPQQQ
ncbi:PLAC8 family-domain-containing protein [Biscogniauxia marginata]|nr:PLAC8 family-domain-containing protein [Biscogniauxia marginata]